MRKRVLVTGGSGFLGGFTVLEAQRRGYHVDILDMFPPKTFYFDGRFIRHDLVAPLTESICECNYDYILHFAGILGVETSFANVAEAARVNVLGTINLMDWVKNSQSNTRVVQFNLKGEWYNPYMISKHAAESYGLMYFREAGIPYLSIRPLNVYGPRQGWKTKKIGPMFILNALQNKPIPIYGDGNTVVNLAYVKDMANCFIDLMELPVVGEIIELPDPNCVMTVQEFAALVLEITGSTGGIKYCDMRKGEPEHTLVYGDKARAVELLANGNEVEYSQRFTDMDKALRETVSWYKTLLWQ